MNKPFPILRFAAVIAIVGVVAVLWIYTGGWLCPRALKPVSFINRFQQVNGVHPGFRRNHAKGVCVSGWFDSNGQGTELSRATVFEQGRVPVIGRFSLGVGNPYVADKATDVRGLGIRFMPSTGEEWRTAMINLPVFPFPTPQGFYDQMLALAPDPATGKPDPERVQAFLAKYPETAKALKIIKSEPMTSGFDNSTYNSLNAFKFVNDKGETAWVRWSLVPIQPFAQISPEKNDANFLFDALIASVHQHPLQWHLILIVAQPGDSTVDSSLPWPPDRRRIDAGTLTINQVESDDTSPARDITFDPLILPDGIAPSADPLLSARSAIYSRSFTRREGEPKNPSPVSPAQTEQ